MSLAHSQPYTGGAQTASPEPESELIERAKRDPQAFGVLYERYHPMLLDHVYRRTGDVHATEDLVADVFVIVMRSLPGYRYRGVPLRFWILRIATNAVNRWARRKRRGAVATLDAEQLADVAEPPAAGEVRDGRFGQALLTLPPRYQAVLSLYHLEGLSVKETAAVLRCREGTVRSRLTRARQALREKLNGRRYIRAQSTESIGRRARLSGQATLARRLQQPRTQGESHAEVR